MPRVLLHQVEQDPLKRGRGLARPPLARLADVGQVVRGDDRRAHGGLHVEVGEQGVELHGRLVDDPLGVLGEGADEVLAVRANEPLAQFRRNVVEGDGHGP